MAVVKRQVLLNPGPATTTDSVKQALVIPDICPREESFCNLYADVLERLARLAGDPAEVVALPVVGSGTTALEASLSRLIPRNGRVVIVDNGDYGTRLTRIAQTLGIDHHAHVVGFGRPIDIDALDALRKSVV